MTPRDFFFLMEAECQETATPATRSFQQLGAREQEAEMAEAWQRERVRRDRTPKGTGHVPACLPPEEVARRVASLPARARAVQTSAGG